MQISDLERYLKKVRKKYGDIQVIVKNVDSKEIQDISVYEIEGFNYFVIGVDEDE